MATDRREREAYILDVLTRDGTLSVAHLARDLGVSEVTIRAQLRELETRGLLSRTHGGAQSTSVQNVLERQREHEEEKERIARAAAALVEDGDRAASASAELVQARVRGDPVHPGAEARPAVELREVPDDRDERLLRRVGGVRLVARDPEAHGGDA